METIHVKFDELIAMASECNNLGPSFNCLNFRDSSEDLQTVPLKTDLDNLFGPLYKECYATSTPEVSDNFAANTLDNKDTPSSSSIVVEEDEAPQIVSSSAEPVATGPNTVVSNVNANELVQEDVTELDINVFYNPLHTPVFEEAESSSTYQDSSRVKVNLKAQIMKIRTNNETEFKYKNLRLFYAKLGIVHNTSIARTPQQNGVVERTNHTLVEAARTMLIYSKTPGFLWAEDIATACFTHNRSIVHTRKIMETIHVKFDELTAMASECNNLGPSFNCLNFRDSSEDLQTVPLKTDLDNLFGPLYKECYATSTPEVSDNSAANTLDNKDTPSSSSIVVEEDEAP
nr:putative ribonuclease H-like domain-containing protein [Tanacetum cinerariifolium]